MAVLFDMLPRPHSELAVLCVWLFPSLLARFPCPPPRPWQRFFSVHLSDSQGHRFLTIPTPPCAVPEPTTAATQWRVGAEIWSRGLGPCRWETMAFSFRAVGRGGGSSFELVLKCLVIIFQWELAVACQDGKLCQHGCQRIWEIPAGSNWQIR